jgi:4-amino-4-deoxy-L-arabinose transferase-like glycosyltransferase
MVWAGLTIWLVYLFGARAYGRWAGVIGALLLALMPRVFYHSHLACFDVPIMSMWTLSVYVYWRATQERTLGWAMLCGFVYGLTLLTKHNAWELPFVYVIHAAFTHGRSFLRGLSVGRVTVPATLVAIAVIGPIVFYLGWPWVWNDTANRVREYFEFHTHHEYYNMEFLGQNYNMAPSPRSYAPIMILATVPAITLALALLGIFDRGGVLALRVVSFARAEISKLVKKPAEGTPTEPARRSILEPPVPTGRDEADLLFFGALTAPLAPFLLLPTNPIFGGTKHWLPAYPFLALFAGRGLVITLASLERAWPWGKLEGRRRLEVGAGLVFLLCLAPLLITSHSHPFGLSSYVPIIGGTAGGADLGLNRQFWGFTTESVAPYLEKNAPRHASVFIHDTSWDAWQELIEEDRIRNDLRGVGSPTEAEFALVQHELHMNEIDYEIWIGYGTDAPVYVLTHDNVPIVSVYRRK